MKELLSSVPGFLDTVVSDFTRDPNCQYCRRFRK